MSESLDIVGHISQIRPSDILFEFKKDDSVAIGSIKIEDIKVCHLLLISLVITKAVKES